MRFPDDTGRASLDVCAHCGRTFVQHEPSIFGVKVAGERRVVHGACLDAFRQQAAGRIDEKRPRLRPRKPQAFT